jgi:hypothetical protein
LTGRCPAQKGLSKSIGVPVFSMIPEPGDRLRARRNVPSPAQTRPGRESTRRRRDSQAGWPVRTGSRPRPGRSCARDTAVPPGPWRPPGRLAARPAGPAGSRPRRTAASSPLHPQQSLPAGLSTRMLTTRGARRVAAGSASGLGKRTESNPAPRPRPTQPIRAHAHQVQLGKITSLVIVGSACQPVEVAKR